MIGIDISDTSVKVIQLSHARQLKLLAYCWKAIPENVMMNGIVHDQKVLRTIVREALTQCRLPGTIRDVVVASIPETQSFLRVVEVPLMTEDEVGEAVQWEVAQHIPFGLENVYLDWQPVRSAGHTPKSGRMEVLVGASQKKVVDPLYDALQGVGLDVAAFELESQAIVRALVSKELQRQQGLLIVDLGGSSTNVVIHDHGAMRFTASLQKGVRTFFSALSADAVQRLQGPPGGNQLPDNSDAVVRLRPLQEELVMEIRGVVEFYNSIDASHAVKEIVLTGGGANLPGFDQVFSQLFDTVQVQRGNPWVNILPAGKRVQLPLDVKESVHYSTAIGLALRPVIV